MKQPNRSRKTTLRRAACISAVLLAAAVLVLPPTCAKAQPPAAATQPTTGPATDKDAVERAIEEAGPLSEPLFHDPTTYPRPEEFIHNEWIILMDKVYDGTENLDPDALYLLLEKVSDLAADDPRTTQVTPENLLDRPKAFRGRPVRMRLKYRDEQEVLSERPNVVDKWHLARTAYWKREQLQPVWLISREPFRLPRGTAIEATGYFFKLKREAPNNAPGHVYVPVIVVAEVTRVNSDQFTFGPAAAMAALIIVLLVVYVLMRYKMGKGGESTGVYRPRRGEMTDDDIEASRQVIPPDQLPQEGSDDSSTEKPQQ